jgi:hypothetical protein
MTTIPQLHQILMEELRSNTRLTPTECYQVLDNINQSESLGEWFRSLLQVLNSNLLDVTDPKLKGLLRANGPILLLIKKINKRGEKVDPQAEYDAAVEFFNSKKVNV